ncbi:MAG TPA: LuxR C-terminal-related transcriptional regulator [Accumulibacter sp.]|nr:LuxR C-terminal-related transcriptional regulator [Accumulibacter sp.]
MRGVDNRQQRLLDIIDLVYEGMDREQMLAALFAELRQLFAFSSGVLLPIDPVTLELQGAFSFDCPSEHAEQYLQHYVAFDPYVCRPPNTVPINRTVRFSDIVSPRQIDCSEFADFMANVPYRHALAAVIGLDGQPLAAFSVHRRKDQRDFGSKEVAVFDRIAPHLGRALALRSWKAKQAATAGVGLLAVGANGQALFMNTAAERLLPAGDVAPVLAALPPGSGSLRLGFQNYRVSRVPWQAVSMLTRFALHDCDEVTCGSYDSAAEFWAAIKSPDARLTVITLVPFRRREDLRRRLAHYGLSPRELDVAEHSIRCGLSTAQLAQHLCISEETVKSHLRETYRKIGVGSRMGLLTTILGLDG